MTNKPLLALASTVTMLVAVACSKPGPVHSQWRDIDPDGWAYGDTLTFEIDSDSVAVPARLALQLRHDTSYEYANLWVELTYASGDTVVSDTFNLPMADAYGRWLGTGTGLSVQAIDTIQPRYQINPGSVLKLRHIMRVDTLPHINQLGMSFE